MNRRKFIGAGSLAGLTVSALGIASCNTPAPAANKTNTESANAEYKDDFALNEITIDELQRRMQTGESTSKVLTQMYLDRIEAVDKKGPALNAVIEINPDALTIAAQMDDERKAGKL